MTAGYVVIVDFRLKPGMRHAFRKLIDVNAAASVRDEPGCRRFDVAEVRGEPDRILLYEIYDNEAAFQDHCKTPHFNEFNLASEALVDLKITALCDLVFEGQP
ncbi:MAG: antibiotic biosynthesis monooxygenase [Rhizobiaceae bacterium]|nr:antibiotic biosynthesis monooxygenase [Rhizobiaceae bacterium]